MEEENKQTEETKPEVKEPVSTLDQAKELADRMKAENDRYEALVKKQEQIAAVTMLGGKSDNAEQTQERKETPQEYKNRILGI